MLDDGLVNVVSRLRVVFVFAAGIVSTDEPEYSKIGWRSIRNLESDKTGPAFGYERVQAAALISRINPNLIIVPSGGAINIEGGRKCPPISSVVAFELKLLGVSPQSILEEPLALNTLQQIIFCAKLARLSGWCAQECGILAPVWQFSRIMAMIMKSGGDVTRFGVGVSLLSIERVLAANDSYWNSIFDEWYRTPEAEKMFAREDLGAGQLWVGHQPGFPNPFNGFSDPLV